MSAKNFGSHVRYRQNRSMLFVSMWGRSGVVFSALDFRSEGRWLEARSLPSYCSVSLDKKLYLTLSLSGDILLGVNILASKIWRYHKTTEHVQWRLRSWRRGCTKSHWRQDLNSTITWKIKLLTVCRWSYLTLTLRWTSNPSGGSSNTLSCFMLQITGQGFGRVGLLGSCATLPFLLASIDNFSSRPKDRCIVYFDRDIGLLSSSLLDTHARYMFLTPNVLISNNCNLPFLLE